MAVQDEYAWPHHIHLNAVDFFAAFLNDPQAEGLFYQISLLGKHIWRKID
jgi:hypothetical protein